MLEASYNQVVPLRQKLLEARAFQVSLWDELVAIWAELAPTREETQHSQMKLKALRDFLEEIILSSYCFPLA
jgi:hypothetical protein